MAETKKSEVPDMVRGQLEPATRDGFVALLAHANTFLASPGGEGYRLLTIVRLEKAIAAVFVRGTAPSTAPKITEFWEADDNEV